MKPILFHNPKAIKESFHVQEDKVSHFYDSVHFHPEYQLTLILSGSGTAIVGDHVGRFKAGDLFLLGPNLPHVFRCDDEYYEKKSVLKAHCISVYFLHNSFGDHFFKLAENASIDKTLLLAQSGIQFSESFFLKLQEEIKLLLIQKGFTRLIALLEILDKLSVNTKDNKVLASLGFVGAKVSTENDRVGLVMKYIMENYTKEIRLDVASEIACMTSSDFCRFYKKKTRKTFIEFVEETRIGYSCKLLQENSMTILEIAYKCGYKNISNYNRQFKKIMKVTPTEYSYRFASIES